MGNIINPYRYCDCIPATISGDRTASITVTASAGLVNVTTPVTNIVDGASGDNSTDSFAMFTPPPAASGHWIQFDFGKPYKINSALWTQRDAVNHGTWKWQGSDDATTWIDIGNSFTFGGTSQTQTELNGNVKGYRYYRILGVSGTVSDATWNREIVFDQCACF